jgi:flagellar biosynthesis/type III secretory pathway protein FliH
VSENVKPWELHELQAVEPTLQSKGGSAAASRDTLQSVRVRAEQQGYEAGLERGLLEAVAQSRLDRENAVEALEAAHNAHQTLLSAETELRRSDALSAEEASREAVELAYRLCEQILEREVTREDAVLEAAERAVALLVVRENVVLRVNPQDVEQLKAVVGTDAKVVSDPMVMRGGCVAEAGSARVDLRWEAALLRVRESLGLPPL